MEPNEPARHAASLGGFLRAMRERQVLSAHGLAGGKRRRTPGLRREEVAQLCGLSVTWYTWIEQGRDVSVSSPALARLARGLRLTRAERNHLFELAGKRDPEREPVADGPPEAMLAIVDAIDGPAYVLDLTWTARRWNAQAARLFAGWLDDGGEPNLLRYIFLRPEARSLLVDWEVRAGRVVAEFRAAVTNHENEPALARLIDELGARSADFARYWAIHGVQEREGGERTFRHPVDGLLHFQQVSLSFAGWPHYRLTMLVASPARRG
ncbi:MAG: helix-turn-helix transcriptional regulator [Reyranellaceae bacterium]